MYFKNVILDTTAFISVHFGVYVYSAPTCVCEQEPMVCLNNTIIS